MGLNICEDLFGSVENKSINQKRKGNRNELIAAKVLSDWVGEPFARVPSSGGLRWKNFNEVCGDVVCQNRSTYFPFSVETKHLKHLNMRSVRCATGSMLRKNSKICTLFMQALEDAKRAKKMPILMVRANGMKQGTYYIFITQCDANKLGVFRMIGSSKYSARLSNNLNIVGWDSEEFFNYCKYKELCLDQE